MDVSNIKMPISAEQAFWVCSGLDLLNGSFEGCLAKMESYLQRPRPKKFRQEQYKAHTYDAPIRNRLDLLLRPCVR